MSLELVFRASRLPGAHMKKAIPAFLLTFIVALAFGQQPIPPERAQAVEQSRFIAHTKVLECGVLIDETSAQPLKNVDVIIEGDRIREVRPSGTGPGWTGGVGLIDLKKQTCLPGLIDTHTHIVLQGDIIVNYDEQLLKDSDAYRAIRATVAAKNALDFGFTGCRKTVPHLQRLAVYAGEALDQLEAELAPAG